LFAFQGVVITLELSDRVLVKYKVNFLDRPVFFLHSEMTLVYWVKLAGYTSFLQSETYVTFNLQFPRYGVLFH
jgi:hypothetical protein